MRLSLAAALVVLPLAGCPSLFADEGKAPARPALGVLDVRPSGRSALAWRITDASVYGASSDAQVSFLWLGGPEGSVSAVMGWSLTVPFTGDLTAGRVIDLAPVTMAYDYVRAPEFSGGVVIGGECGTPSWSYGGQTGRLTVESVTAEIVTGTLETTLDGPSAGGPFGGRVTVRAAFRAAVQPG